MPSLIWRQHQMQKAEHTCYTSIHSTTSGRDKAEQGGQIRSLLLALLSLCICLLASARLPDLSPPLNMHAFLPKKCMFAYTFVPRCGMFRCTGPCATQNKTNEPPPKSLTTPTISLEFPLPVAPTPIHMFRC